MELIRKLLRTALTFWAIGVLGLRLAIYVLTGRVSPALPVKYLLRVGAWRLSRGNNAEAMRIFRLAAQRLPHDIAVRQQIGVTAFLSGDYGEAEKWFASMAHFRTFDQRRLQVANIPYRVLDQSWMLAIGHVASIDTYIKAVKLGWYPEKTTLLAHDPVNPPPGWPLFQFFSRDIRVITSPDDPNDAVDEILHGAAKDRIRRNTRDQMRTALSQDFWSGPDASGRTRWFAPLGAAVESAWKQAGHGALYSLGDEERVTFRGHLKQLFGLPEDAWYVLLHVREPGFHAKWHRHHPATRNADIGTYSKVVDFVLERGGWVIRGGDPSMAPYPVRERVIDYATSIHRSPEIDVLLCAECAYFVGSNSGYSLLPPVFGKRCALTNWSPLGIPNWYLDDVYIPKLVWHRAEKRFLTFEEMYASAAGWSQFMRDFTGTEWEIIDNTPEDLLEVVQELHAEVFDAPSDVAEEDAARLSSFNAIALRHGGYIGSRMSYSFLRRHADLLADLATRWEPSPSGQRLMTSPCPVGSSSTG